jgi:predicted RNase H-like HicB family nuclease
MRIIIDIEDNKYSYEFLDEEDSIAEGEAYSLKELFEEIEEELDEL